MKAPAVAAMLATVLLAGCDQLGVNGFNEKIKPTRDDKTFTMTVETIPASTITDHCSRLGVKYDANGCAAFNLDTKHCTIYVVEPRDAEDAERFAVIGHETWHCRFGEWHN
jgi:hypothetical protein